MLRIGESVPRFEDHRLLTGRGRYTADVRPGGEAHLCVVRSPHAHARIVSIDASGALAMPGVLCVVTGRDIASLGTFPSRIRRSGADGRPMFEPPRVTPEGDIILKRLRPPPLEGEEAKTREPETGGLEL